MGTGPNHHGFPMEILQLTTTPFYYYDLDVLRTTLAEIRRLTADGPYTVHYAVKANGNPRIISELAQAALGPTWSAGMKLKPLLLQAFRPRR